MTAQPTHPEHSSPDEPGKRVSWVELYLDLIFVLAVGQLAHLIAGHPERRSVWIALGLFLVLWWTWIGFAVLYNRRGADVATQRLLYLVASVPTGVAAVAIAPASTGHSAVFAGSLAATRLVLGGAHSMGGGWREALGRRITRAFMLSTFLFTASIWVPEPWRYVLWAVAVAVESGALLTEDRAAAHRFRRDRDLKGLIPADPAEALDAHHFAERFGLFLIILLGEVVVSAGQGSVEAHVATTGAWAALVAAMILAAALWWLYFDAAADINLRVLELSGGSPVIARTLFAAGHMIPSFALLLIASGIGLLLERDPPPIAPWLACIGLGMYLIGTRVSLVAAGRVGGAARVALLVATFLLARLGSALSPHGYVWLLAGWTVACAAIATLGARRAADVDIRDWH